jgi:hypothetical protein
VYRPQNSRKSKFATDPFFFHVLKEVIIQAKFSLQGAVGNPIFPLEKRDNLGQQLKETHHRPFTA